MKILAMQPDASRREFLRGAARYGLLSLMAALTAVGLQKGWNQKCQNQGLCSGCSVLGDCGLPQAISFKRAQGGG
jgi:hypothetical protein